MYIGSSLVNSLTTSRMNLRNHLVISYRAKIFGRREEGAGGWAATRTFADPAKSLVNATAPDPDLVHDHVGT